MDYFFCAYDIVFFYQVGVHSNSKVRNFTIIAGSICLCLKGFLQINIKRKIAFAFLKQVWPICKNS